MFSNKIKHQSQYGEIKQSYAYENFYFKGQTKGIALKYVKQGTESYLINDKVIHVKQGQFILVPEGQKFEAQANLKSQNIQGLCIDLNPTKLNTDLSQIYNNPLLFNLPFDCFNFSPISKQLHATHSEKCQNEDPQLILKALNEQLQIFSEETLALQDRLSIKTKKIDTQRSIIVKLISSKNFIHQHFNQNTSLDQLAKYSGISKYHFLRLFKLCFQQSPIELRDSLRMKKAIELINYSTTQFNTIACELGYTDLASFSNKFKSQFGLSPSQYRKMID